MKIRKKIITGLIFLLLFVCPPLIYFYVTQGFNNFIKLEIIGKKDHKIADFSFINQNNDVIINDSLKDNIYISNFFFTSCPTICPVMTKNMSYVQSKLKVYPGIRFLSHTVDPINDTPRRMLEYINKLRAKNINIDLSNWDFVTGKKRRNI
jgi:protein SCO1/2